MTLQLPIAVNPASPPGQQAERGGGGEWAQWVSSDSARCCFKHDCCYGKAEEENCAPKTRRYPWECKDSKAKCGEFPQRKEASGCLGRKMGQNPPPSQAPQPTYLGSCISKLQVASPKVGFTACWSLFLLQMTLKTSAKRWLVSVTAMPPSAWQKPPTM